VVVVIQTEREVLEQESSYFLKEYAAGTCWIEGQEIPDRYKFLFCPDNLEWMQFHSSDLHWKP
jgi:hypothetical protein